MPGGRISEYHRLQSGSDSDAADRSMAARCVSPTISNTTIAAGGVIRRPPRRTDDEDDPVGPGVSGGPGGFGAQPSATPSPWISYRRTQDQYGRPTPIPSAGDEESNGPADGSVRHIMASGFREMKKSMITVRVKERYFIKI